MDHLTHMPANKPPTRPEPAPGRSFTIRLAKPNWQVVALILIAIIAGFQTIQLVRLKGNVTAKAAASAATATSAAPSSGSSDLQSQVGGC